MSEQFTAFTIKSNGLLNRITSQLGLSEAYDIHNPPENTPNHINVNALWDTGATGSVISANTAAQLGLTPTGTVQSTHAGGVSLVNTYVVNMYLPNTVSILGVNVSEFVDAGTNIGAIIGMDVIARGDFSITNVNGKTCMSFRYPSIEEIDYVKMANIINYSGVGRNDPCPCNRLGKNGKPVKFKHCHGKNLRN